MPTKTKKLSKSLKEFIKTESSSGVVMLGFAALAILLANSPLSSAYSHFTAYEILQGFTIKTFIKDVFMAIFFFLVGMELKREMTEGNLAQKGQKILPLIAALGGIIAPAIIFLLFNLNHPENIRGWAIPTATDIAFALCVLSLIGKNIPSSAKTFLLAIAIYDDLAAIVIIAIFYSSGIALLPILAIIAITSVLFLLNRYNIWSLPLYLILGAALWFSFHESGIHTTVSGVILGALIPLKNKGKTPLNTIIHHLHPWVAFGILPIFAFVSAGINFSGLTLGELTSPLTIGIILSLFLGKPIGIFSATYLATKLKIANKPNGSSWRDIFGISAIAGIGFTMSLFIGFLAFNSNHLHDQIKIGVIIGSLISALFGYIILKRR